MFGQHRECRKPLFRVGTKQIKSYTNLMENLLNLNDYGMMAIDANELQDIDGGSWAHIIGGAIVGALAGAEAGASVGTIIPGVGNVAGAVGGAILGAIGGGLLAS
jgi:hypothetical protein